MEQNQTTVPSLTRDEIYEKISTYLIEYFEVDPTTLSLESKLYEDLDLDSIDAVDLIVKLQDLTQQKIAPNDFKQVRTVSDVVDKVYDLVQK